MALDELSLSELQPVQRWQDAALGRLLLIGIEGKPEVGIRCDWPLANGAVKSLLIVGGNNAGKIATEMYLNGPALDVSELVEVVAKNPLPFSHVASMTPGMLFEYEEGFYVWFEPMSGTGSGFVCVAHKTSPNLVGGYERGLKLERIGISHSIDIRRKEVKSG